MSLTFRRSRHRAAALLTGAVLTTALTSCSLFSTGSSGNPQGASGSGNSADPSAPTTEAFLPYDVRPLLRPKLKYLGVSANGAPASMQPIRQFATDTGKQPDIVEYYSAWGDRFQTSWVRSIWQGGALPYIAWEPRSVTLADIAAGKSDAYLRKYAAAVRDLNIPVALSFAHEFNGGWYPWGTRNATPAQYVAAYRHVHDVFDDVGAGDVIWVWSPNIINPVPTVALKPYYPGDTYIDWVGIVGYYARTGAHTFRTLYGPTVRQVRTFTSKPFLIAETASEPTARKPQDIADLFKGVLSRSDFLGFVWFDYDKETDWRVGSDARSLSAFRRGAADQRYGFDPRRH